MRACARVREFSRTCSSSSRRSLARARASARKSLGAHRSNVSSSGGGGAGGGRLASAFINARPSPLADRARRLSARARARAYVQRPTGCKSEQRAHDHTGDGVFLVCARTRAMAAAARCVRTPMKMRDEDDGGGGGGDDDGGGGGGGGNDWRRVSGVRARPPPAIHLSFEGRVRKLTLAGAAPVDVTSRCCRAARARVYTITLSSLSSLALLRRQRWRQR